MIEPAAHVQANYKRSKNMLGMNKTKYAEIGRRLRELPMETTGSSYEWEELVQKLCASNDDVLHVIGIKELDEMNGTNIKGGKI